MAQQHKTYAGIGSRKTPQSILPLMTDIASFLSTKGYVLRSGGADGADIAFEKGATAKEIYLPWKGFNENDSPLYEISEEAMFMAQEYHPSWDSLTDSSKLLHARNCQQIMGIDLCSPVDFVVCWTLKGNLVGGTAQALRIAISHNIRILNLGLEEDRIKINQWMTLKLDFFEEISYNLFDGN